MADLDYFFSTQTNAYAFKDNYQYPYLRNTEFETDVNRA